MTDEQLIKGLSDKQRASFEAGTKAEQQRALDHLRLKSEIEGNPASYGITESKVKPKK